MKSESSTPQNRRSILQNWFVLYGLMVAVASIFSFLLLFTLDFFAPNTNPYIGIIAYLIAPVFLVIGVSVAGFGVIMHRWRLGHPKPGSQTASWMFDLSIPKDRRKLIIFSAGSIAILLLTSIASYHSYHYTESVQFCGQACHTVMSPQFTAYQHSPHARVACSECHIGSGASSYINAKLSGLRQVYAVTLNKYDRPVQTKKALRPAQETCEHCHWPEKFMGNLDKVYTHFLSDQTNQSYSVRLLLKVGGADATRGPVGGIHWHMNVANKIEFISLDPKNQVIPWVRLTTPQGVVTEFVTKDFKNDNKKYSIHKMDCMDCHNRPAHLFQSPNDAVDHALSIGLLDPSIPFLKKIAVDALTKNYTTTEEALQKIATDLDAKYANHPKLKDTIERVQAIYKLNFFPSMQANWKSYPNNLGHKDWPGCFRCHDGEHTTLDKTRTIKANDCNACHTVIAQGSGVEFTKLDAAGQTFKHPGGEIGDSKCNDCHNGSIQ
jgi:nitrate/TMAO reductase-like tetraheme cytochrome c subunit